MTDKEKRKSAPRRRIPLLVLIALFCFGTGLAGGYVLHKPEKIIVSNLNTNPKFFTLIYALQDIPCGTRITPETVVEVVPPQITVEGYFPPQGLIGAGNLMNVVPGQYARHDIEKSQQLQESSIDPDPVPCA